MGLVDILLNRDLPRISKIAHGLSWWRIARDQEGMD